MPQGTLTVALGSLAAQLPVLLVWVAGAALALAHWRRHPRVSLLTLVGLGILMTNALVGTFLSVWLPMTARQEWGMSIQRMGYVLATVGFARSLIGAAGWSLVLAAIFTGRDPHAWPEKGALRPYE